MDEQRVAAYAEVFEEWLFRMHGVTSSCDHRPEAGAFIALADQEQAALVQDRAQAIAERDEARAKVERLTAWHPGSAVGAYHLMAAESALAAEREAHAALRADAWDEGYRYGRILQAESMAGDAEDIGAPLQVRNWLKNSVPSLRRNLDGVRFRDNPYRAALSGVKRPAQVTAEAALAAHELANGGCVPADAYRDLGEAHAALRGEVERLTHLLGSHADGHRCTCTLVDAGNYNVEGGNAHPPEWEQDPWCPTHPDVDQIKAALGALIEEWRQAADHGEDEPYGRIIARTLRGCADDLWGVVDAGKGDRSD